MTTPEARAIVDVLLSYFVEHGWTIHMDDRPGQPDEPFIELAAALAPLTPLAPEVPPRRDGLLDGFRAALHVHCGPLERCGLPLHFEDDAAAWFEKHALAATRTPEPPDSGDGAARNARAIATLSRFRDEGDPVEQAATLEALAEPRDAGKALAAAHEMTLPECLDAARGHLKPAIGRAKSVRPRDAELIELLTAALEELDGARWLDARLRSGPPAPEGGE